MIPYTDSRETSALAFPCFFFVSEEYDDYTDLGRIKYKL